MDDFKLCADCVRPRDIRAFYPHPGNPDGRASRCISCAYSAATSDVMSVGQLLRTKPVSERYRRGRRS
jgi:hypothetical protein